MQYEIRCAKGSLTMKIICVLGGTGFVGSAIVRQLSEAGYLVKVLTRNCQKGRHLASLKNVQLIECDPSNSSALKQILKSADVVINLIGILHETTKTSFEALHTELPRKLALICKELNIPRFIQMSALQASTSAPSNYLRSKGKAEEVLSEFSSDLKITIFQPSVIFGPCDSFINLFAKLIKFLPVILLAKPDAKFQPIYVEDVAAAVTQSIQEKRTFGKTYTLTGPKIYTLMALVKLVSKQLHKKRLVIGLNDKFSYLQAWAMEKLPKKMMTRDNVRSMEIDSTSSQNFPDYLDFKPRSLESILPSYIN